MAKTRAEREAEFRAEHGVSSGTYYEMRRKAESRGISGTTFDRTARNASYNVAKNVAQVAATNLDQARYMAGVGSGALKSDLSFADFMDIDWEEIDIPEDWDWWYHG
jgi:hypothetical protein